MVETGHEKQQQGQPKPSPADATDPQKEKDQRNIVLAALGLVVFVLIATMLFYGQTGEMSAAGLAGVGIPALTTLAGFFFGYGSGKTAGTDAQKSQTASAQNSLATLKNQTKSVLSSLEPSAERLAGHTKATYSAPGMLKAAERAETKEPLPFDDVMAVHAAAKQLKILVAD